MNRPLRLGISSCLLGDPVRWDGRHERRDFLADVLGPLVEWVRACPELEAGLGVPREPIAFVREGGGLRLQGARSRADVGPRLEAAGARILAAPERAALDGYVLKSRSPSCGIDGARVYATAQDLAEDGPFERAARGVFARRLMQGTLPVADETMLADRAGREHFVERCFAERRVREALAADGSAASVMRVNEAFELQVLARSAIARTELAALAATDPRAWRARFAAAMAEPPRPERVRGVLERIVLRLGTKAARAAAEPFASGNAGLDETRAALRAEAAAAGDGVLLAQTFLDPDPGELLLRRAIAADSAGPTPSRTSPAGRG